MCLETFVNLFYTEVNRTALSSPPSSQYMSIPKAHLCIRSWAFGRGGSKKLGRCVFLSAQLLYGANSTPIRTLANWDIIWTLFATPLISHYIFLCHPSFCNLNLFAYFFRMKLAVHLPTLVHFRLNLVLFRVHSCIFGVWFDLLVNHFPIHF